MRALPPILTAGLLAAAPLFAVEPVDYAAKIVPLFEEHCVDCHSESDADGDFALHTFEALMKGGKTGPAIEPKNAQDSLLVKFLEGRSGKTGKNQFMPPGKNKHLTPEQIALIRQWIDAGAQPPTSPVKTTDVLSKLPKIAPKAAPKQAVQSLAYSATAKLLAAGSYASVRLLDPVTQKPVRTLEGVAGKVNALVFSPDGQFLFAAAGESGLSGVAYQWKVSDGTLIRKFEGHTDALYTLALSPDGQTLATGSYDQKIKLWKVADGSEQRTLSGHTGGIFGLSFRPDGKVLASASGDRTVKLWDLTTGKRLETFAQPFKEQTAVAFSPDGKTIVSAGVDNRIRLWQVSDTAQEGSNPMLLSRFAHEGTILNLAFSADGKTLISTASDRSVKVWNTADMTERFLLEAQPEWAPALATVANGQFILGRLDGSLGTYDAATGKAPTPKPVAMTPPKPAMPPTPELTRIEPRGVQSGAITRIKVLGKNLGGLKQVKFSNVALQGTVASVDPKGTSAEIDIKTDAAARRTQVEMSLVTASGETAKKKLLVDYLPQRVLTASKEPAMIDSLPVNLWGTLAATGQQDSFKFRAKKGQTLIFDMAARRLESKAVSPRIEILDSERKLVAANNGLDSGADPFVAFTAPRDGEYTARVLEITLEGSPEHTYRLTVGELPYVTGWWPLSVPANRDSTVHLVGHNLTVKTALVTAGADGEVTLPLDTDDYRSRVNMRVLASPMAELIEQEPNDTTDRGQTLTIPSSVNGRLYRSEQEPGADFDTYAFDAEKGQQLVIETRAAMLGSPADTKIEVLDGQGEPVPQTLLQATKDSWITLRSEDANDPAIRLGQFDDMELNDYMYFNGEVLKIFRLARGPDSDMVYFTRGGTRRAYFNTSPSGHGLDEPCYVVETRPVGSKIIPNGLPIFTLNYANDDDSERQLGKDSKLFFTAPAKGRYTVRVSDTRGWSGERYAYRLMIRAPQPDFTASLAAKAATPLPAGSGQQFVIRVDRQDGWDGDIKVDIAGVPPGFFVANPVIVPAGHLSTAACLYALPETKPGAADFSKVTLTATAMIDGKTVSKPINGFPALTVAAAPKQALFIEPENSGKPLGDGKTAPAQPYEITIVPGDRIPAWLRVDRKGNDALINLDVEGLPFGVIVDSIGLNGVQIRAGENEREIFLSCAKWVPEQDRLIHVVTGNARANESTEGLQASFPVLLKIRKNPAAAPVAMSAK